MRKTGLAAIASVKRRMRAKVRFTNAAIEDLKDDQDEMLRGAQSCVPSSHPPVSKRVCRFLSTTDLLDLCHICRVSGAGACVSFWPPVTSSRLTCCC
jgi:hypothetical protein